MKLITRLLAILVCVGWIANASAAPISNADIVTVDGRDWVQVDLFLDLSLEVFPQLFVYHVHVFPSETVFNTRNSPGLCVREEYLLPGLTEHNLR